MRRYAGHFAGLLFGLMVVPQAASGQAATQGAGGGEPYTIHVDAREVVVEVVAVGSHGRPVTDLAASDFQVSEGSRGKRPEKVSAVHLIDPVQAAVSGDTDTVAVAPGKTCATRSAPYYMLAYRVGEEGWASGFHEVQVTTSRAHVKLSFRHRYYVGATVEAAKPQLKTVADPTAALQEAACYHADVPASLNLRGRAMDSGAGFQLSVVLKPDSLAFTSLPDGHAQFDYAVCTFNAAGTPLRYMQSDEDRAVSAAEAARSIGFGYQIRIALERIGDPVFARFVVRDRQTGNLGSVGMAIPPTVGEQEQAGKNAVGAISTGSEIHLNANAGGGAVNSFGLPIPKAGALCGDVYELPETAISLPDYWDLEPVGAVYTESLDVPNQPIMGTIGIPGVTRRTVLFGIDYWGAMWVKDAGEYDFELTSDDGSMLYIDDQLIVDNDGGHPAITKPGYVHLSASRHTIHIPYFQWRPGNVALVLRVKRPGGVFKPFDVRDFAAPAAEMR